MKQPSDWQFISTPYFFAPGLKGNVTVKGTSAALDMSFGDILDNFDVIGFSTHFEAWHKPSRWGFIADVNYLSLDGNFNTPIPGTKVNVQMTQLIFQAAAGYRLVSPKPQESGEKTLEGKLSIDVMGGARFLYLDQDLDFTGPLKVSDDDSWFQPYIGERIGYRFNDKTTMFLRGDIGYMQSGSDRSTIWNVLLGVDYKPWSNVSLKGAYGWQDINVQSSTGGGFGENLAISGPTVALSIYW